MSIALTDSPASSGAGATSLVESRWPCPGSDLPWGRVVVVSVGVHSLILLLLANVIVVKALPRPAPLDTRAELGLRPGEPAAARVSDTYPQGDAGANDNGIVAQLSQPMPS